MWGVDNTFLSRAIEDDVFEPYTSPGTSRFRPALTALVPNGEATPVDFGDVCVNYDMAWFADHSLPVPTSLADLADPAYASLLVVENPATSSPGLAFLLASIAEFGTERPRWPAGRSTGSNSSTTASQVVDSWTQAYYESFTARGGGDRPLVVSYGSSPPAEVLFGDPPPRPDRRDRRRASGRSSSPASCAAPITATKPASSSTSSPARRSSRSSPLQPVRLPGRSGGATAARVQQSAIVPTTRTNSTPRDRREPRHLDRRVDGAGDRVNRLPRRLTLGLAAAPLALLAIFYLWPFLTLLAHAVDADAIHDTLSSSPDVGRRLVHALAGGRSTALTLLVGLTPAYVFSRYRFPGRTLLLASDDGDVRAPDGASSGAAILAIAPDSIDHSVWAVMTAHVIFNLAVVVRVVGALWERLPRDMEAAAATLGASRADVFRHVTADPTPSGDPRRRRRSCSSSRSPRTA